MTKKKTAHKSKKKSLGLDEVAEAFERVREEVEGLSSDELIPVNVDVTSAVSISLAAAPRLREVRDELAMMPGELGAKVDGLEDMAFGLLYADLVTRGVLHRQAIGKLVQRSIPLRDKLLMGARAAEAFGLIEADALHGLPSGRKQSDLAFDLASLVQLYASRWEAVGAKLPVTDEDLEEASSLSGDLYRSIGARASMREDGAVLRQRAFTVLKRAYDDLKAGVDYLRRRERDANEIAPTWFSGRTRRRRIVEDDEATLIEVAAIADAVDADFEADAIIEGPVLPEAFAIEPVATATEVVIPVSGPRAAEPASATPVAEPVAVSTVAEPIVAAPAPVASSPGPIAAPRVAHVPVTESPPATPVVTRRSEREASEPAGQPEPVPRNGATPSSVPRNGTTPGAPRNGATPSVPRNGVTPSVPPCC